MIYSYQFRLPFIDTDTTRSVTVGGALDLMQDAADAHTISAVDPDYLAHSNRTWILNSWLVYFDRPCYSRDILTMSTWSSGAKRMFATRNFTITNQQGEVCIRARTYWFLVNSETLAPVRITDDDMRYYETSPALSMDDPGRKIPIPADSSEEDSFPVRRFMLDAYGHVNNAWYVRLAQEYLPEDFSVRRLRAEYKSAAHLGDTFLPLVSRSDHLITVVLAAPDRTPYAVIEFSDEP